MWHPNQIKTDSGEFAVKNFWWAAQGAYNTVANGVTDENASIIITPSGATNPETLIRNGSLNGKAMYGNLANYYCYWDSANSRWELYISYGDEQTLDTTSASDTTYPWQATWVGVTVARQATTFDTLATDGDAVIAWRDIISGEDATSSGTDSGLFESDDLDTKSIKFDPTLNATDFFTIPSSLIGVFNLQNNCYIFAGAQDTNRTSGDATHGVVSINRSSTIPKLGLFTRATSNVFRASASSNNSTAVNASSTSDANYNVLTSEALFTSGSLRLRVNGSQTATTAISTTVPNTTTVNSFIGASTSSSTTNFNGYMTAIILASGSSPMSATDRSRIERFIGLLDGGINIPLV
jgi:hypothetical protein